MKKRFQAFKISLLVKVFFCIFAFLKKGLRSERKEKKIKDNFAKISTGGVLKAATFSTNNRFERR
ncbi:hypothetical protein CVULP_0819 [Campylobacter vulpis]|nr:hypothetical protein [Campylobacter vulpis]PHY89924.1 hypothetical protein AA995_07240 [Campylobacter vulpis]QNF77853.1 hypothetical protein CVULP_0819 [Campylobacter vulpis]